MLLRRPGGAPHRAPLNAQNASAAACRLRHRGAPAAVLARNRSSSGGCSGSSSSATSSEGSSATAGPSLARPQCRRRTAACRAALPGAEPSTSLTWSSPGVRHTYVPFKPDFFSSRQVLLSGSWEWSRSLALPSDDTGEFAMVLELPSHLVDVCYKYNVGERWLLSRSDAAAADSQGCVNNTTCGRKVVRFSFPAIFSAPLSGPQHQEVHLIGSFTAWQVTIPMALGSDGSYHCDVSLPPGHHTFKFVVNAGGGSSVAAAAAAASNGGGGGSGGPGGMRFFDGSRSGSPPPPQQPARFAVLDSLPLEMLVNGTQVNSLRVPSPPLFRLLFHTPACEAYVTYRYAGHDDGMFSRARLYHLPGSSGLMVATLPAPDPSAALEFSITAAAWTPGSTLNTLDEDAAAEWWATLDATGRPPRGGDSGISAVREPPLPGELLSAPHPGTWRLRSGVLSLDDASQLTPLMLCTDLDGTLIEECGDESEWQRTADESTSRFSSFWGRYIAPAGGVLVYNTGRSIGMVEGLLSKKGAFMPWPAAIITAVGTKVFLFDVATQRWAPDPAYSQLLDDGWDLQEVSRVAHQLMGRFSGAASVVDSGTEHPHRLSLSLRSDVVDEFCRRWADALNKAGVKHQLVSSIGGEWRFVDCIAHRAGKGHAMAYLASKFGINFEDSVAAGDSGNDLLMLGPVDGRHHPSIIMSNSHPEVWDWLQGCTAEERMWIYTPKKERAAGLVEGLKAIVADKLAQAAAKQLAKQKRQLHSRSSSPAAASPPAPLRALRG